MNDKQIQHDIVEQLLEQEIVEDIDPSTKDSLVKSKMLTKEELEQMAKDSADFTTKIVRLAMEFRELGCAYSYARSAEAIHPTNASIVTAALLDIAESYAEFARGHPGLMNFNELNLKGQDYGLISTEGQIADVRLQLPGLRRKKIQMFRKPTKEELEKGL